MFNAETKQRYIDAKMKAATLDAYFLKNLFKRSEQFEIELNKDICNFTTKEIENMFKTMNYYSYDSLVVACNGYKTYTDWCMAQGFVVDSQNHFAEFTRSRLSELTNRMVQDKRIVSRDEVVAWCDQLPNPSDGFIILGMFEGIKGKDYVEFTHLEETDIDYNNRLVMLYGRNYPIKISAKLTDLGRQSAEETIYRTVTSDSGFETEFAPSNKIIKEYHNCKEGITDYQKGRRINNKLRRIFAYLGVDYYMNGSSLINSGIIHMIKTESQKMNITVAEYADKHISDVEKQFGRNIKRTLFWRRNEEYLN